MFAIQMPLCDRKNNVTIFIFVNITSANTNRSNNEWRSLLRSSQKSKSALTCIKNIEWFWFFLTIFVWMSLSIQKSFWFFKRNFSRTIKVMFSTIQIHHIVRIEYSLSMRFINSCFRSLIVEWFLSKCWHLERAKTSTN